jgi:4-amino-4-deoxy-L-arabinose transferase-like glycosyltransferase
MFFSTHRPFYLLLVSLILCLIVARLVQVGMFMDGMLYNSVAHNLAHGIGTFWFPYFAKNTMPFFHEQPPLTFFIESLFYRALGDGIWVDKTYSFFTLAIAVFLVHKIWQTIVSDEYKAYSWLPMLLWLSIDTATWGYSNCMEENTMSMFVLSSVWLQCRVIYHNKPIWHSVLAGILLAVASLCKGFPGLFPLGLMGFAWLTAQTPFKKATLHTLVILGSLLLCYALLYWYPESNKSLSTYLNERVFNSIKNNPNGGNDRTWIFHYAYDKYCIALYVLVPIIAIGYWRDRQILTRIDWRKSLLFLILCLAGTAPLMVTLEQRGFYTATAIPYTALGFAILVVPVFHSWLKNATPKWDKYATIIGCALLIGSTVFVLSQVGKVRSDYPKYPDYAVLAAAIPAHTEVRIPGTMWNDWDLQCAMARFKFISLQGNADDALQYCIKAKTDTTTIPPIYTKQNIATQYYDLYVNK